MRFSEYFGLNRTQPYLDFVDIPLDTDLEVFLEPISVKNLNSVWGNELSSLLQTFFEAVLRYIRNGEHNKAQTLLSSLSEGNEFHLGFSSKESRGHGFGVKSAKSVWSALTQSNAAVTGLLKDLEDTVLFLDGIGEDMISDALCNILRAPFIKYTQDICNYYHVPLTPNVVSGSLWNPVKEKWETGLVDLPMTNYGKIILVPKILVRLRIEYNSAKYYRHYILPEMQEEHINARSPLIEVLRDGTERVTKKSLIEKYGSNKLAITEQTVNRTNILDEYREEKMSSPTRPLTHEQFSEVEEIDLPDINPLLGQLSKLPSGLDTSGDYEEIIERIFSVIFYPSLCNPTKQTKLHEGRKRVDITYTNEAKVGFFSWLASHYACPMVFVECKNYGKDVGNPAVDQLAGRFSPSRGEVGILVCRSIKNKTKLYQRCSDTVNDRRGYIIALDDDDLMAIANEWSNTKYSQELNILRGLWDRLIN